MTVPTLAALAGEAFDCFEIATRDDGESYVRRCDDAPEWVGDLVRAAHDFLPDDWRYASIWAALGAIEDAGAESELACAHLRHEWADDNVDTYSSDRVAWLASNLNRADYVDAAVENFGQTDAGIFDMIGQGQYAESEEIFDSVVESLIARRDEIGEQS